MSAKQKKTRPVGLRSWMVPLGLLLGLNLIMLLFDRTQWTLLFREGTFFERLINSKFFTETFTPYSTPEFNVLTILFVFIFIPEILINAIKYMKARRKTSS